VAFLRAAVVALAFAAVVVAFAVVAACLAWTCPAHNLEVVSEEACSWSLASGACPLVAGVNQAC